MYWLAVPAPAIVAYLPVLGIGFLSDDYVILYSAHQSGIDPSVFVPEPNWYIYRPLGVMLIWQLGWQLWGFNPLPFHIQGLLLHAGTSLLLGLWLAEASGRRALGWLAGALFAGYCVGVAGLLYTLLLTTGRGRRLATAALAVLVVTSIFLTWAQLQPWLSASKQTGAIEADLNKLIPPRAVSSEAIWYVQGAPDNYHGAYMFRLGLGLRRYFTHGSKVTAQNVPSASQAELAGDQDNVFAIVFRWDKQLSRFEISYIAGITQDAAPPRPEEGDERLQVWDFRTCEGDTMRNWQAVAAEVSCVPGKGLVIEPTSSDPQLVALEPSSRFILEEGEFIRLRAQLRSSVGGSPYVSQWYWQARGREWSEEESRSIPIKQDDKAHVYWTFLADEDAGGELPKVRFDPINAEATVEVGWIAVELVR